MTTAIARLQQDHVNMLRLLDLLERELEAVEDSGQVDFDLMSDVLHYLVHYCDAVHHPMEDLVYARLAERSIKARGDLSQIPAQHQRIEAESRRLYDRVRQVADGGMALRSKIVDLGRAYVSGLRKHIEMEERHLFPLAELVLDAEDFSEVARILDESRDPVFGPVIQADFRNLFRAIERHG